MIGDITSERIANAICQDTSYKGKYILVEGQNDYVLFRKFFDQNQTQIQNSHGKEKVLEAYDIVNQRGFSNVIGIVDSDFDNLNGIGNEREFIYYTDTHDLETMLFASDALDAVIDTHCEEGKLTKFLLEEKPQQLRDILFERSSHIGYLKWANNIYKWGLLFKPKEVDKPELKVTNFLPKDTLKFKDIKTMVNTVFNYSRGKVDISIDENTVVDTVTKLSLDKVDYLQLCNGHDLATVFSIGLKKKISSLDSNALLATEVERDLVLAYEARHFSNTRLYKEIKDYEDKNGYRLLNF
jgi:hypothetical protein